MNAPFTPRASEQLAHIITAAAPSCQIARYTETDWASQTFRGARHNFTLRFDGANAWDGPDAVSNLIDRDPHLRGHLIADINITRIEKGTEPDRFAVVEVSFLTLEERAAA